ncbi:hypothetical protein [Haloferula sargassicola]
MGETRKIEVENEVRLLRYRVAEMEKDQQIWSVAKQQCRELATRHHELADVEDDLRDEIETMKIDMAIWLEERLADLRSSREGETFPEITSASGKSYHHVTVTRVSEAGVEFRHAGGLARLTSEDLTSDQLSHFGIDPERSVACVAREKAMAVAYSNEVDLALTTAERAEEKRAEEAAQRQLAVLEKRIRESSRRVAASTVSSRSPLRDRSRRPSRGPDVYWTGVRRVYYPRPTCYGRTSSNYRQEGGLIYSLDTGRVYPNTMNGRSLAGHYISYRPQHVPVCRPYPYR